MIKNITAVLLYLTLAIAAAYGQSAVYPPNTALMGPPSGPPGFPTVRAIVGADVGGLGLGGIGWINAQSSPYNAVGNGSTDDTAHIQAAIDAAAAGGISTIYLPKPSVCYKTTAPIYLDPPSNLRSNFNNPPQAAFSLGLIGEPGTAGNHEDSFGSKICPGAGYPALIVGTGQGMKVANIALQGVGGGQAAAYRCGRIPGSPPETGIYIAGGGGGSSRALIEQVWIENFFYGIAIGLNNGALGDSNSFRKITINNTCTGIEYGASQNFINDCIECNIYASGNGLDVRQGGGMTIVGGNWSATNGKATGVMTLSAWSGITATLNGNQFDYTFTATLGAPAFSGVTSYTNGDVVSNAGQVWWCINFGPACTGTTPSLAVPSTWEPIVNYLGTGAGGILGSFAIVTTHYGVIPMTMTSFTQATSSISFKILTPWSYFYFPQFNAVANGDLQAEVQTGTTLYAAERVSVFLGAGINATGVHVENPSVPTQLINSVTFLNGSAANVLTDIRNNYNPASPFGGLGGTPAQKAQYYVAQTFPYIFLDNIPTEIKGSAWDVNTQDPILIDINGFNFGSSWFKVDATNYQYNPMVQRFYTNGGLGSGNFLGSSGFGVGEFQRAPFTPFATGNPGTGIDGPSGRLNMPHWGARPAPIYSGCVTTGQFSVLSGALPAFTYANALSTFGYPFLYGGQVYNVCDWYVGTQTHYQFESTHHFYSIGQNLTTTNVSGLSWSYKGQGAWVYADAKTLQIMFPGLGVILNDGSSDIQYLVTGVWPSLGYFSVVRGDSAGGGQLSGIKTTVITGTLIKQEAYSLVFP
jgi:hypothetical protein